MATATMDFATSSKSALIGSIVFLSSGMDQTLVGEAFADHSVNRHFDEAHGASFLGILAERKFVDVAMKVLLAHVVVDAIMAALEQRPEAFDAVGVDAVVTDVFTRRMIDGVMDVALRRKPAIGSKVVGDDSGTNRHVCSDKALEGSASRVGDRRGANLRVFVTDADDCSLANATAAKV